MENYPNKSHEYNLGPLARFHVQTQVCGFILEHGYIPSKSVEHVEFYYYVCELISLCSTHADVYEVFPTAMHATLDDHIYRRPTDKVTVSLEEVKKIEEKFAIGVAFMKERMLLRMLE